MQQLRFIRAYIHYCFSALTSYDVHSPFLYDLITKVFSDKKIYTAYDRVENLKHKLLSDKTVIEVEDYGAGSKKTQDNRRSIRHIARYASRPKKYGRLLYRLARYFKPDTIVELGTSLGLGSAYLAQANPDSKIWTIEGAPIIAGHARQNFELLNIKNPEVIIGQFDLVLPGLISQLSSIDMAFIDGNHQEEPTIRYFELLLTKSANDTVLIFDDIHWSEGMERAWSWIIGHPGVTLSIDLFQLGLVFLRKELAREHFVIRF